MIPYILAAVGGYLIAQSRKDEKFADGGDIKSKRYFIYDDDLPMFNKLKKEGLYEFSGDYDREDLRNLVTNLFIDIQDQLPDTKGYVEITKEDADIILQSGLSEGILQIVDGKYVEVEEENEYEEDEYDKGGIVKEIKEFEKSLKPMRFQRLTKGDKVRAIFKHFLAKGYSKQEINTALVEMKYADGGMTAKGGVKKASRGLRISEDWQGKKRTEYWGKNDLDKEYQNSLDLIADVKDYERDLYDIDKSLGDDFKKDLNQALKTGKITGMDGSSLKFKDGGVVKNIKLYHHKTSGGAEYLCSEKVKGTKDEGSLNSPILVRIDGAKTDGGTLYLDRDKKKIMYKGKEMQMVQMLVLFYHKTDGGAEYLCSSKVKGTKDEGSLDSKYVVRIDGAKKHGGELMIKD